MLGKLTGQNTGKHPSIHQRLQSAVKNLKGVKDELLGAVFATNALIKQRPKVDISNTKRPRIASKAADPLGCLETSIRDTTQEFIDRIEALDTWVNERLVPDCKRWEQYLLDQKHEAEQGLAELKREGSVTVIDGVVLPGTHPRAPPPPAAREDVQQPPFAKEIVTGPARPIKRKRNIAKALDLPPGVVPTPPKKPKADPGPRREFPYTPGTINYQAIRQERDRLNKLRAARIAEHVAREVEEAKRKPRINHAKWSAANDEEPSDGETLDSKDSDTEEEGEVSEEPNASAKAEEWTKKLFSGEHTGETTVTDTSSDDTSSDDSSSSDSETTSE